MSRIGDVPIPFGDDVEVDVDTKSNRVTVDGPKGRLGLDLDPDMTVTVEDGALVVRRPTDQTRHKSLHGLYHSLLENVVEGVQDGFSKELELRGIGYTARIRSGRLELELGYSHPIIFVPPEDVEVSVDTDQNNPIVRVEGVDKRLVGEVASKIRSFRPPEVYKGKGVRYRGEEISLKPGKAAVR